MALQLKLSQENWRMYGEQYLRWIEMDHQCLVSSHAITGAA